MCEPLTIYQQARNFVLAKYPWDFFFLLFVSVLPPYCWNKSHTKNQIIFWEWFSNLVQQIHDEYYRLLEDSLILWYGNSKILRNRNYPVNAEQINIWWLGKLNVPILFSKFLKSFVWAIHIFHFETICLCKYLSIRFFRLIGSQGKRYAFLTPGGNAVNYSRGIRMWGGGHAFSLPKDIFFFVAYLLFPSLYCFTYPIPLTKTNTIYKIVMNRGPWMKLINLIGPLKRLLYRLNQFDLNYKHFSSKKGRYR